ncbi:hypothetical protein [Wolbachia endosymbiont (group A) of Clivina fossor]|uniref:hypothetical protein n=1 Tax=Wolbachia endosymbiont (group A) of Clivina fossor TaxID=3066133 RepID=UPI0031332EB6
MIDDVYLNSDGLNSFNSESEAYSDSEKALYDFFHEKSNADYEISINRQFLNDLIGGELHYKVHVGDLFSKGSLAGNHWSPYQEEIHYRQDIIRHGHLSSLVNYYFNPFAYGNRVFNINDHGYYNTHVIEMSPGSSYTKGVYTSQGNASTYYIRMELDPDELEVRESFCASLGCGEYRYKIDPESIKIEENSVSFYTGREYKSIPEGLEGKIEVTIKRKYSWV